MNTEKKPLLKHAGETMIKIDKKDIEGSKVMFLILALLLTMSLIGNWIIHTYR